MNLLDISLLQSLLRFYITIYVVHVYHVYQPLQIIWIKVTNPTCGGAYRYLIVLLLQLVIDPSLVIGSSSIPSYPIGVSDL